jgi:dipeptidyl aminopeptidase/acylaminoacyl peptidase
MQMPCHKSEGEQMKPGSTIAGKLMLLLALLCTSQLQAQILRPLITEAAIPVEAISPVASDGFVGEAYLRKPPGDGPFPAVILVHGGAPRWDTATLRDYVVHTHATRFLAAGYVVVAITRRDLDLNLPFGEEPAPVRDAVAIFDFVKALPYVDKDSVFVRGTSVGGYLTLELAAERGDAVAAILVEEPFSFPFVGVSARDTTPKANTAKLEKIRSPVLHIRGDQTPNINDFNRDIFLPAVEQVGLNYEVLTYPGELHSFAFYDSMDRTLHPDVSLEVFREIDDFFRLHASVQPQPVDRALVQFEPVGWGED